jgi:hypothetical protein
MVHSCIVIAANSIGCGCGVDCACLGEGHDVGTCQPSACGEPGRLPACICLHSLCMQLSSNCGLLLLPDPQLIKLPDRGTCQDQDLHTHVVVEAMCVRDTEHEVVHIMPDTMIRGWLQS